MKKQILKAGLFMAVVLCAVILPLQLHSQKVAFIASEVIRENFTEAKQADQRINTIVNEWKRELETIEKNIDILESEIKKNRLIWTDYEKQEKEKELENLKTEKMTFARTKYETNGEYDKIVKDIFKPIWEKIYAAVQEVSNEEGYDIIFDKSVQPLPYTNYKYDLTVKVLRKLGVDVDALEKEQQEKINKDPRNQQKQSKEPPKRTKSRTREEETRDVERGPGLDKPFMQPSLLPDSSNQGIIKPK
ncbi:MAG: OmpH family outer membrane protein [Ignavibacteriae bacterium]|nr:OmpH family outer membrane protein [Ignavibacteriota bacterium]